MKKIMFNDRYGLTQAVIHGRKTVTRRVVKDAWWPISKIESEANARLIAAAPEMLAALQEIVRQHGLDADNTLLPPIPNRWMDAISKAEKAINKALGR